VAQQEVKDAFIAALDLDGTANVENLEIGVSPGWDSIGHMTLIAELEDRFAVSLDTDDLVAINSFAASLEVLRRHGVEV
jgi:acyl carrier protein